MVKIEYPSGEIYFDLDGCNYEIEVIDLCDGTDVHNNLVVKRNITPLNGVAVVKGKIFFARNYLEKKTFTIVSMSPDIASPRIILKDCRIKVEHCNYPIAYGWCELGCEEQELRTFFSKELKNNATYTMVNNWGDLNLGKNVNYDFCYREIDAAHELGADVVQIDDGWQIGSTQKTRIYAENGDYTFYHDFYDGFWEVDTEKFPHGLQPIIEYATKKNVKLGLWFAPDSKDGFKHYDRDIRFLRSAYQQGFRYFKLDMVVIKTDEDCRKFKKMLREISEFGQDVFLQIDVTGNIERLGFLCGFEYGKIFVENRFCGRNMIYYPHLTLKNLWKLSKYMPAQLFQFEIPNRKHFTEFYKQNDLLAPITYQSDYLFVSVMVSNPLLWMEVQELDAEDRNSLKGIMKIWKEHRKDLFYTDIMPIGTEPNGSTLTGFLCVGENYGYFVALREVCEDTEFRIALPYEVNNVELLVASSGVKVYTEEVEVKIEFTDKRQYAFGRFER